jgi:ATP-dependent Zn protease
MSEQTEWIPVESDYERVATHEAGHAVVGLSLGTKVDYIERLATGNVPEVLQAEDFHAGLAVNFTTTVRKLEPRLQFLIAFGGMAAETLIFGKYHKGGAASDLENLKPNILSEVEIAGLIEIAQKILNQNLKFFHHLRKHLTKRLRSQDLILAKGAGLNARFKKDGTKVDVSVDVESLLLL